MVFITDNANVDKELLIGKGVHNIKEIHTFHPKNNRKDVLSVRILPLKDIETESTLKIIFFTEKDYSWLNCPPTSRLLQIWFQKAHLFPELGAELRVIHRVPFVRSHRMQ